jgi:hypothetical protein
MPTRLLEVLSLAAEGLTDKEIANRLGIGETTIITHWKRLRERYELPNRASIIARHLNDEVAPLRGAYEALLYEVAMRKQAEAELAEANARLAMGMDRRAHSIAEMLSDARREGGRLKTRVEELEALSAALAGVNIVVSKGELYFPFRKTMISDHVRHYGYEPQQFLSGEIGPKQIIHPDDFDAVFGAVEQAIEDQASTMTLRYRFLDAFGGVHGVTEMLWIERDGEDRPSYTALAILDS